MTIHPGALVDAAVPLVVDVDGTLIVTDLLHETAVEFLARKPLSAYKLLNWMYLGRAMLKSRLVDCVDFDVSTLPLRVEVLAEIRTAQREGRPVYLASASDGRLVGRLAERIGGIAGVFASNGQINLAGRAKAARLVEALGAAQFDYIGDQAVDYAVWSSARQALVVAHTASFEKAVLERFPGARIIARPEVWQAAYLRALRPHQWAKNLLLFLPLLAGHRLDWITFFATAVGLLCFCAAASSAYILNDLLDLSADRRHPRKKKRPFASGEIPIAHGFLLSGVLFLVALTTSLTLPPHFRIALVLYAAATICYSAYLKRKLFVDIIVLGCLYTLRVIAGLAAGDLVWSQWLLMFCFFLFMSLATVKRCSELVVQKAAGKITAAGRGYQVADLATLTSLAAAAGYGATLVVSLYISSPDVVQLYAHPERLWLVPPIIVYWVSRTLVLANRGRLHDDPVIFAVTDRVSLLTGACILLVVGAAL